MSRTATLSLDSFDPEVLDAARDVARRAGVSLESWIESVVSTDTKGESRRRKRQASPDEPAAAVPSRGPRPVPPSPIRAAVDRPATALPIQPTDTLGPAIDAMMRRLDALDRSLTDERRVSDEAATRAIEKIEGRIAAALDGNAKPAPDLAQRLAEIERRMGDLNQQVSAPRPLGRRGRPLVAEIRDAVQKVRQRQRQLDEGGLDETEAAPAEISPVVSELQSETSRLREALGGLATGRDVGTLEQAVRTLAADLQRAREPADLAAIAAPIELIRTQVGRLADEVADNVHARLSGEVERLTGKVDGALRAAPANLTDHDALDNVFRELDEIRRLIGALAGPDRIQSLAHGLQAISTQIAQLEIGAGRGGAPDDLKPLLEEIRRNLKGPDSANAILGRIDALADKVDRVGVNPVGDLIGRLEHLGETLRRPAGQDADFANIQRMLRSLAEKIDHVGASGGGDNLDALEKQVVAIARRLDARGSDPAIAGLEQMMGDLLNQVASLRDAPFVESAVERATRRAVAETMGAERGTGGTAGIDLLRADLANLFAQQAAADQRMQTMIGSLNTTLERLVGHVGPPLAVATPAARNESPGSIGERLLATTAPAPPVPEPAAVIAPRGRSALRAEAPRLGDELLEPGASRPTAPRPAAAEAGPSASAGGDIKANFIAAARRAAQAAQADVDAPIQADGRPDRATRPRRNPLAAAASTPSAVGGIVARLRSEIDKRRRPLLLGLAAVVLMIGALQALDLGGARPEADAPAPAARVAPLASTPKAAPPAAPSTVAEAPATAPAKPAAPDPQTTQAIAAPPAVEAPVTGKPATVQIAIPRVASMDSLKAELAGLPASLSTLRQAALEGDGAAIFELATRESDGRGMPRDLALAAKLYEKLAGTGYAPAQFKIGSFYEKGSGVIRDLAQAKAWYSRAAEQGNVRSMHNLAVIHAENPTASGKPDFASAASWFRRAAEYGVRDSQYNLAVLYARGLGVGQDLVQSYVWFSAAATQGDEEAGRKREDVAGKLNPKDLAAAKGMVAAFRAKTADPAANDVPAPKSDAAAPMSLLGAPPPGSPPATTFTPSNRRPTLPTATGV